MRLGVIPDNLFERLGLMLGLAPVPLAETHLAFMLARTIMIATRLGVFDALRDKPSAAKELSEALDIHPRATEQLLNALVGSDYLKLAGDRYALTKKSRRWLLDEPGSLRDKMLLQFLEWEWFEHVEAYVKTGEHLDVHKRAGDEDWRLYQRGMRSAMEPFAHEVVKRLELPPNPSRMLDIGGSHGYWSVALCRRFATLSSTILELPQAIEHAAPILAREGMGDRVVHRAGNALEDDLGRTEYDLILIANLVHHFTDAQNRELAQRCATALLPGGVLAVFDTFRLDPRKQMSQPGSLFELYFGMTSASGTWPPGTIAGWQREAGLAPRPAMRLRLVRDMGVQAADKPSA